MSWSRFGDILSKADLGGEDLARELADRLQRHTSSLPCNLADDSMSHDDARALVARAIERLASEGAQPSQESCYRLYNAVRNLCMFPIHYQPPDAADALDRRLIAGFAWIEHLYPDADGAARRWARANLTEPPGWLAPLLVQEESGWRVLARRLDAFDGQAAAELLGETIEQMRRGFGDEIAESEVSRILRQATETLVPKLDPSSDADLLMDFADQCSYLVEDEVGNEDEPTTDPLKWSLMGAMAYAEVVLAQERNVVDYVRKYMPEPRPEWLRAVLQ